YCSSPHSLHAALPISLAWLLPADTIAVVSLAPVAEHESELRRTGLARLLGPFTQDWRGKGRTGALEQLGIENLPLQALLGHGVRSGEHTSELQSREKL